MTKTTLLRFSIFFLLLSLSAPLSAQDSANYLIRWSRNPEPDVTTYIIYRSLDRDAGFEAIDSVTVPTISYLDPGLPKGVRYYYRVVAKNFSGERSAFSNPVSGIIIPQNANESMKGLCRITSIDSVGPGQYDISWLTQDQSIGFVQYDYNIPLDSMSAWDDDQYTSDHNITIGSLITSSDYFVRAASYDSDNNMTVSAIDTIIATSQEPAPPTAPSVSIYPVPYHPAMGNQLTLANLPAGGSVMVFNERGQEVWSEDVGTETTIMWSGTNVQGSPVTSGVYYVLTKDASGKVVNKRAIMIVN